LLDIYGHILTMHGPMNFKSQTFLTQRLLSYYAFLPISINTTCYVQQNINITIFISSIYLSVPIRKVRRHVIITEMICNCCDKINVWWYNMLCSTKFHFPRFQKFYLKKKCGIFVYISIILWHQYSHTY
jgi:hypothetical protein